MAHLNPVDRLGVITKVLEYFIHVFDELAVAQSDLLNWKDRDVLCEIK